MQLLFGLCNNQEVYGMKKSFFFIILFSLFSTGCGGEQEINGMNVRTANRSLIMMKRTLPSDKRLEFEIAFWTLKDAFPKNSEFLDMVDGQNADQVIELGKQYFIERKASGAEAYTKYTSWDDMLVKVRQEREATALPREPLSDVDKQNNVLYKL